jgi:hypothetical protein
LHVYNLSSAFYNKNILKMSTPTITSSESPLSIIPATKSPILPTRDDENGDLQNLVPTSQSSDLDSSGSSTYWSTYGADYEDN